MKAGFDRVRKDHGGLGVRPLKGFLPQKCINPGVESKWASRNKNGA